MTIHSLAMQQALKQLQSMRDQVHGATTSKTPAIPLSTPQVHENNFQETLKSVLDSVNQQQKVARNLEDAYARGEDVPITDVAIAMQKASVAFDATVQVRNKILDAYHEISTMSV
jgi:flagellar hook-basal body complex protein FliE